MTRIVTLSLFLIRDMFRSLQGAVPPVLTLALYGLTRTDRLQVSYLLTMGGASLAFVCFITALLIANRSSRASSYPFLARVPHRAEFLAAIILSALLVTFAMAVLFVALALGFSQVALTRSEIASLILRWLALFLLAAGLGLNVVKLASRGGSYLLVIGLLAGMALLSELRVVLPPDLEGLMGAVTLLVAPIRAVLTSPAGVLTLEQFTLPLLQTIGYGLLLFVIAAMLFQRKDLLWAE